MCECVCVCTYVYVQIGDVQVYVPIFHLGYEFLVTLGDGTLLCYRFINGEISLFGNR